jgi:cyclic pyranopterin phosphate synthase
MLQLCQFLAQQGIQKIRITGGEPFIRKDLMPFLEQLVAIPGINTVNITTNGILTAQYLPDLKRIGINNLNISLDTLDPNRFFKITHRYEFDAVMNTVNQAVDMGFDVKLNAVVMHNMNIEDILPLVALTKEMPISVRFLEEMPFNGEGLRPEQMEFWSYKRIMDLIRSAHPELYKLQDEPNSTSYNYHIPNFKGTVGVIAAFSRTFCGTCNRIRVTPTGSFRTCLYDDGVFNVRDFMRQKLSDEEIKQRIYDALQNRAKDGFEAESRRTSVVSESMTTIGG